MTKLKNFLSVVFALLIVFTSIPAVSLADGAYTVSFDSQGGSAVESVSVEENALIAPPAAPTWPGHDFAGWFKEAACQNEWNFAADRVTGPTALYAKWTTPVYTITAVPGNAGYGSVSGGGSYGGGDTVDLKATPADGYRFVRWVEPNVSSAAYAFAAGASQTVTAEFAPIDRTSVTAIPSSYNSVALTWTEVAGATGYEVLRSDGADSPYHLVTQAPGGTLAYTDADLTTGKTYYYKVRAYCTGETVTTYCPVYTDASATPLLWSTAPAAAPFGYASILVSWAAVPGAAGYELYSSTTLDGNYNRIFAGDASQNGFIHTGLVANATYYYKVRAYTTKSDTAFYSDLSAGVPAAATFAPPALTAVSASHKSVSLSWNSLPGVNGYVVYRATKPNGRFSKIYTASSPSKCAYTDSRVKEGNAYYYKVLAYRKSGKKKLYSPYSAVQTVTPMGQTLRADGFALFYQGDSRWRFSSSVRKTACLLTSYAITISNMGLDVTPRTVLDANGGRTSINMARLGGTYGIRPVCALDASSPYLAGFDGHKTYISSPGANGAAAVKEALDRNPEGVILYFKKGSKAHAIVACRYDGDTIYYSDPGRNKKTLLTFKDTWTSYKHRMTYGNLVEMVALDR